MASKLKTPVEQISEDIVDQELILPNEEASAEEVSVDTEVQGHPSRDFKTPIK
jgi:hypothetical protein